MNDNEIILIKGVKLQELINKAVTMAFENAGLPEKRKDKTPEKLLTRNEVCDILKISLSSLTRRINDGSIRCYKIGARSFFKANELEDLLTLLNK